MALPVGVTINDWTNIMMQKNCEDRSIYSSFHFQPSSMTADHTFIISRHCTWTEDWSGFFTFINLGRIQDFHGGGGKRLCARFHIMSAKPRCPLRPGSRAAYKMYKGPGSFRVILMLSRAICALFQACWYKMGLKTSNQKKKKKKQSIEI